MFSDTIFQLLGTNATIIDFFSYDSLWVSECVDLYSALSLTATNALDALVTRGQV